VQAKPIGDARSMTDLRHEAPLPTGTPAPEFDLPSGPDATLGLRDLHGRPAVLAFYPADWSPVCSDQLVLYQEIRPMLEEFNAQIVGISVDGVWCHRAFAQHRGIEFPLLADFEPKGAVSHAFGAYRGAEGVSERALFVLDPDGAIHWSYVSPIDVNPGADGILHALKDLTGREAPV
jgi:peroxiredoxin